jgi:hypothetical protein
MKKFALLLALLAALLLAWWFLGRRESARQEADVPKVATQIDTNTVNRLVLSRYNEEQLVFEKDAGGFWTMVAPVADKANQNTVKQIERGLALMKYVDKISERESQQVSFQIDDIQASRLQAYADSQLQADVYLGKLTPDRQHVYARAFGSNTVYSATGGGGLAALRTRDRDSFREHAILDKDAAAFDSLDIHTSVYSYRIARVDSASWNIRIGTSAYRPASAAMVDGLVRALGRMRASGFRPDSAVVDWSKPDVVITSWLLGEPEVKLEMRTSAGTDYWVRVTGRAYDFAVFESVYKTFTKDPKELLQEPKQGS